MASAALWLAAGIFTIVPINFLDEGYWFLNPWSWQFLFVIGMICMMRSRAGKPIQRHPLLVAIAAGYVTLSFFWVLLSWWSLDFSYGLPAVLTGFDKTFLSLTRCCMFWRSGICWRSFRCSAAWHACASIIHLSRSAGIRCRCSSSERSSPWSVRCSFRHRP